MANATRASQVTGTKDVTWEALSVMVVPPVQLQQPASPKLAGALELGGTSLPGGTSELGETPGPRGLDDLGAAAPIPLPQLGERNSPPALYDFSGEEYTPWW